MEKIEMDLHTPVVGILRGVEAGFFREMMPSTFAAGLQALEVTFNTPQVEQIIAANRSFVPPGKYLGIGTVRNIDEARQAVDAGAMFIVTPNFDPEVIEFAKRQQIPIIAGALSPTEVYHAWAGGADMVKVFPCRLYGPQYLKDLKGPFEQIPLVAVGGVDLSNVHAYFQAGACAVGVGSSLFGSRALREKNIDELTTNIKRFINTAIHGKCPRV